MKSIHTLAYSQNKAGHRTEISHGEWFSAPTLVHSHSSEALIHPCLLYSSALHWARATAEGVLSHETQSAWTQDGTWRRGGLGKPLLMCMASVNQKVVWNPDWVLDWHRPSPDPPKGPLWSIGRGAVADKGVLRNEGQGQIQPREHMAVVEAVHPHHCHLCGDEAVPGKAGRLTMAGTVTVYPWPQPSASFNLLL